MFKVPFALKNNATLDIGAGNVDPRRFALGYTAQGDLGAGLVIGGSGGVQISVVRFTDKTYGGYNYAYAGAQEQFSAVAQATISASVGASVSIAYNDDTKPFTPTSYAGTFISTGASADVKFIAGGGVNVNAFSGVGKGEKGWKGVSLGVSVGVGAGANVGSGNVTLSYSWLLNDVKPTVQRSLIDRATNILSPAASAVTTGTLDKIKQYNKKK
ncbi:hypothetical protein [uncultured Chryseobacterium sp.]|uniref:hypothetical protein n=1 Tax=uncultured Chryseobacterium sp. TaxID=259322 RepID=UPI00374A29D1